MRRKSRKSALMDPAFEEAIDDYIDIAINQEKKQYTSDIEPFEAYAARLRVRLKQSLLQFQRSYARGYHKLLQEVEQLHPKDDLSLYRAKLENLDLLSNPHDLIDFFSERKSLYELLSITEEAMVTFFEAGVQLIEEQCYQDAVDVFFFLVNLAPNRADFWLDLGYSYAQLGKFQEAVNAYFRVIDLEPQNYEGYLCCATTFVRMEDYEQALKACDMGLSVAHAHSGKPQAELLLSMLEEAKQKIESLFIKSKDGTFTS